MGLVSTSELLKKAIEGGYAVGAFNISNMETVKGIAEACYSLNSPVIFQASSGAIKYAGIKFLVNIVKLAISEYNLEASLHLDHGSNFEICKECIDNGFNSVMIDASSFDFDSNVRLTKEVVDYAKKFNVDVEAEVGKLLGNEEHYVSNTSFYTDPDQASNFVKLTNVNSLAVAVGTSHGAYKFKSEGDVNLKFDIIKEIESRLPNFPLVLHGASSINKDIISKLGEINLDLNNALGVPENILRKASKTSICKINIDTDIRIMSTLAIKKIINENPDLFDPRIFFKAMKDAINKVVKDKINNVLLSKNKAF